MKHHINFLVQASSKSWSGGSDLCMNILNGKRIIEHTIDKILENYPSSKITIIAPEYDHGGLLENIIINLQNEQVSIICAHDNSPLARMHQAVEKLIPNDIVVRIDGLHMWFLPEAINGMIDLLTDSNLDAVKAPDDFPPQLIGEVYTVNCINYAYDELLKKMPENYSSHTVHPRYWVMRQPLLKTSYYMPSAPTDSYLKNARSSSIAIYNTPRLEVNANKIAAGDQLSYHYQLSEKYIKKNDIILDIACGMGYGSAMLAKIAKHVTGADIDQEIIDNAKKTYQSIGNLDFSSQDVLNTTFSNDTFDVVVSFETMEHVDDVERYFDEIKRILKDEGILIISTPQNSLGHIPINYEHVFEYSLEETITAISYKFSIIEMIGIKAGTINFTGDNTGTNTYIVAKKS